MLEIKKLSFTAPDATPRADILKDIDLIVEDGTFLVLTGPNGGGKTTLAKTVMGLTMPSSGEIIFDGTDITSMSVTERAKLGIGYAFQHPPRFTGMKVIDLLSLAAGKEKLARADCCAYLTKVGLCAADYVDREVDSSLSGGELKRIEIATVLAGNAKLMIFDEPEAGIDLWSFAKLTETFGELHKNSKATIIIISHQERIISLADKIAVISNGCITDYGTKDEVMPKILNRVGGCEFMRGGDKK